MQMKQLKRTLETLNLVLHAHDGNFANSANIRVQAPDGTIGKFQVSRIDDPHSDKQNLNQLKHFARDHSHSHTLPGIVEMDIFNVTPKPVSCMEAAVQATVLEHDPQTEKYAKRVYRGNPLINPVGRLLAGASDPMPETPAPEVIQPEPEMPHTLTAVAKKEADKTMREAIAIIHNEPTPKRRKTPKTIDRIGQVEFFKLCTVLNEIADKLSKVYGRKIGPSTASDALTATGKKLDKVQVEVTDAQAIIARTLTALLIKLSEPVPDELRRLCGDIE
jgi:hypothetical protein